LDDADIPHRTSMRKRIGEIWDEHLKGLQVDMGASIGKISITTDCWSDPNLSPFMAVTAHWIESVQHVTPDG
ncbi:hypothetical protein FA15DRAFT_577502, partial [Coprinopsis marcescibilis]